MSDLYLVAHKVRGEPAFDIATQCPCPECHALGCSECDSLGYWWIVPTSGHRAYPWWYCPFNEIGCFDKEWAGDYDRYVSLTDGRFPPMPASLPDHYAHRAAPRIDLATALGLRKPMTPTAPLPRRL